MFSESYSGLPSKFEKFRKNIELTEPQRNKIKTSHVHLRNNILHGLNYVSNTFLTGSYKKKTLIRPANDIDVFVVLHGYSQYNITPNNILNKLKKDLQNSYPDTIIKQDKPCIVLEFNHVTFELTPAIEIQSIWGSNFYIPIQSKQNQWQEIENPRILENNLSQANQRLNQMLIPLIKMMKKCKQVNNIDTPSYKMEEIAISNLHYIRNYRDGVQQLLRAYGWTDKKNSQYQIETMNDNEFAIYCSNTLFGSDFPR